MKKISRKKKEVNTKFDSSQTYSMEEALKLAKESHYANFDGSIDVHLKLGIDTKKPEQLIRGTSDLPHGTGKNLRVIFFGDSKDSETAKKAGAIKTGLEELIKEVEDGFTDFDVAVATPDAMPKLAKIARTLGPRGLMPNPKSGTVTTDVESTLNSIKKGKVSFRADKRGMIHSSVGRVSFTPEKLVDNLSELLNSMKKLKPSGLKGRLITSCFVAPTMGLGFEVDVKEINL
jgi:large subunit ribosomal protein L1